MACRVGRTWWRQSSGAQETPPAQGCLPAAFQQLHGAASRVGATETAFAHRYDHYNFIPVAIWEDANEDTKSVQWVRALWEAMQPYLEQDAYLNDIGDEDQERVRAAYGANYERLSALKNKYDPSNFFRLNWNV